ncbi:MAG: DctP family TRAP transporter solute-binding subunit [Candidatus Heteroscillospira sp.]|jgi:tripartite ATP-independent transporter DctP family solute receptor
MKKFRRVLAFLLAVCSLLVITACGAQKESPSAAPGTSAPESKAPEADNTVYTIKYGHAQPEEHYTNKALLDMKEYIQKESNGRLILDLYPNGQLGGDRQLIEACQLGTLEMCNATTASFSSCKTCGLFDLPFLFANDEEAYKVLDSEIGQQILDQINEEAEGFRALTFGVSGLRHISNSKHPIHTPDDLKGMKLRTMENPIHIEMFQLLGANPTPMSISEVFTALQQKTVDGQENPIANIHSYKFNEVQPYISLTGHIYMPQLDVISTAFWDSLPADLQEILMEGELVRQKAQREYAKDYDQAALEEIKKTSEVNELTAEELQMFRDMCAPIYDNHKAEIGAELVDAVLAAVKG